MRAYYYGDQTLCTGCARDVREADYTARLQPRELEPGTHACDHCGERMGVADAPRGAA